MFLLPINGTSKNLPAPLKPMEQECRALTVLQDNTVPQVVAIVNSAGSQLPDLCAKDRQLPQMEPATGSIVENIKLLEAPTVSDPISFKKRYPGVLKAENRLEKWLPSLLDLSLRNSHLNFNRTSKRAVALLCPDCKGLEKGMASNGEYSIWPRPDSWVNTAPDIETSYREINEENHPARPLSLTSEMSHQSLYATLEEGELNSRLTLLERTARSGMEEGGANTLFLILGFLIWRESGLNEIDRYAPLILIPISIKRNTTGDGFRIQQIDEEPQLNVTLIHKLQTDFGICVAPNLENGSGIKLSETIRLFMDAVKNRPGWRVVEDVCISTLTFSRFFMWRDLHDNSDKFRQNALFQHLVENPNVPFEPTPPSDLRYIDQSRRPSDILCPFSYDSSQLRAVRAAANGQSIVLQGPPGTGKSQTIENIIVNVLCQGKSVLFAARKRAALNVVHKRLVDVGLGPFCLELHSNRATQESFRKQLHEAIGVSGTVPNELWENLTGRLGELEDELNESSQAFHLLRDFGKSAHWVISKLIEHEEVPDVPLHFGGSKLRTAEEFDRMRESITELAVAAQLINVPATHALKAVRLTDWKYGIEDLADKRIHFVAEAIKAHRSAASALFSKMGLNAEAASLSLHRLIGEFAELLMMAPVVTRAMLSEPDWNALRAELNHWVELGRACEQRHATLISNYSEALFSLPLQQLIKKIEERKVTPSFFKKWLISAFVRKAVCAVRKDPKAPMDMGTLEMELRMASALVSDKATLIEQDQRLANLFGPIWRGLNSNWDQLRDVIHWADRFQSVLAKIADTNLDGQDKIIRLWKRLATERATLFSAGTPGGKLVATFNENLKKLDEERSCMDTLLELDPRIAWGDETDSGFFKKVEMTLGNIEANLTQFRNWTFYQKTCAKAEKLNLSDIATALEQGKIEIGQLNAVFEKSLADWWARTVLTSVPSLSNFIGKRHESKIQEFRETSEQIRELAKKEAFTRIAAMVDHGRDGSESGELRRFVKGGRKTIRRFIEKCANALLNYKPCFLMSPLSVAQYLGPNFPGFDIVIIDEASQIPTYEAIGVIGRGKQVIVVGDSQQLPPSAFFEHQADKDDYIENDLPAELESILEEVQAAGVQQLHLEWHYRSRHESLIAFSNQKYYENRLNTFPAAFMEHPGLGIRWCEVPDGVYDHGRTRTNRREAEMIVAEVVRRLRQPETRESLGIVTFSVSQQHLVEDLLDEARTRYPEIEPFFSTADEPVFAKNLETIQGDERDVILFSVCYGPDALGQVRMHFGPLNHRGGERRLNVAITRARRQLLVYSTLRPEQIDLSRTRAVGVHHLKDFLEYARRDRAESYEVKPPVPLESMSPIKRSIYNELTKRGHIVDTQFGCGSYRIDLAVRDPEIPGRYLLGIECDGENYCNAASAHDRDHVRREILQNLGWRMHHIWSMEWLLQRKEEIDRLEAAIARASQES